MLSAETQTNLANAKSYFEEHLSVGDYYPATNRVPGRWIGEGAAVLGLHGGVEQEAFVALCGNVNPQTGKRLTQRRKTTRLERGEGGRETTVANRRVFYDFTFSPPKSVSVAALVGNDGRVSAAHSAVVSVAVRELETFAGVQVHGRSESSDRNTGNVVAALFEHETSRALDPHLHTHCIVFNATHDAADGHWKALHNYEMLAAQKFVENVYYHELARSLRSFGYNVVNSARGDFEIAEVSASLREWFSKRHAQIDAQTKAPMAEHPELHGANTAAIREHLAHRDRDRKISGISAAALRSLWSGQLGDDELAALKPPEHGIRTPLPASHLSQSPSEIFFTSDSGRVGHDLLMKSTSMRLYCLERGLREALSSIFAR